jgi:hypothetical protein
MAICLIIGNQPLRFWVAQRFSAAIKAERKTTLCCAVISLGKSRMRRCFHSLGKTHDQAPQALTRELMKKLFIAALKRCATQIQPQNQPQNRTG